MKRPILAIFLFCASVCAGDAPLPNPQLLKQRAIASAEKQEKDRENYSCTVHQEDYEFAGDGSVKKKHLFVRERFFVNGRP